MQKTINYKAAIYIRLSREDEKEKESSSVESQREFLLSYLKEKGYTFTCEYVDDGYTGTHFERPSFKQMLKDVETDKINMIVVKDLSRLGRNNSKVSYYLDEYFPIYGIRFIAVNNDYDSFVQNASLEYAWLTNGINETYCLDISKKVRSALNVRKKKGYFTGWKAPYGYQKDEKDPHKLVIDKNVKMIVKRIFEMAACGKSASEIATILSTENIPNPSHYAHSHHGLKTSTGTFWCARTISEMLTNETYIGNLTQGRRKKVNYKVKKEVRLPKEDWIVVENTHEPIIDKDTFYRIQNFPKNKKYSKNPKLLSGILYCKECGHSLSMAKSRDGKRDYLGCSYYRKYSKFGLCTPHTMNYQKLESAILSIIKKFFKTEIQKEKLLCQLKKCKSLQIKGKNLQKEISHLECNIEGNKQILTSAYIDMKKGLLDFEQYQKVNQILKEEMKNDKQKMEILKRESVQIKQEDIEKKLNTFLEMEKLSRPFYTYLIDKIYISEEKKVEIHFKFRKPSSIECDKIEISNK